VPNYLLAYHGGSMPEGAQEQEKVMTAWMNWFGQLGQSVVDGGAPFGPSSAIGSDRGVSSPGKTGLSGYSVISAASLDEAVEKAKGCPVIDGGCAIDVYEALPMG
jgi:hypothetical protein